MESLWFFHYSVYSVYSVNTVNYSVYSVFYSVYSANKSLYSVICSLYAYSVLFDYSVFIPIQLLISNITHIPPGSFDLMSASSNKNRLIIISRFTHTIVVEFVTRNITGYLIDILRSGRCVRILFK